MAGKFTEEIPGTPAEGNPHAAMTQFALALEYDPDDIYIAVMGVTGSGKSTFISRLVGDGPNGPKIGHNLESCTHEIQVFTFDLDDQKVHLIDTMGFDDTYRSDSDVLKELVFWLNASYRQDIKLNGLIYMHPIHQTRITGSSRRNMNIFRKLCGDDHLDSVAMATTFWPSPDERNEELESQYLARQADIKLKPEYWGRMFTKGSLVFRHDDTRESALRIVKHVIGKQQRTVLQIQREMVDEGLNLNQTSAGQELNRELLEQKQMYERQLAEVKEEARLAVEEGDTEALQEALRQQEQLEERMESAARSREELENLNMARLIEQKDAELQYARREKAMQEELWRHSELPDYIPNEGGLPTFKQVIAQDRKSKSSDKGSVDGVEQPGKMSKRKKAATGAAAGGAGLAVAVGATAGMALLCNVM